MFLHRQFRFPIIHCFFTQTGQIFLLLILCQCHVVDHIIVCVCFQKCDKFQPMFLSIIIQPAIPMFFKKWSFCKTLQLTKHGLLFHMMTIDHMIQISKICCILTIQEQASCQREFSGNIRIYVFGIIVCLCKWIINLRSIYRKPSNHFRIDCL